MQLQSISSSIASSAVETLRGRTRIYTTHYMRHITTSGQISSSLHRIRARTGGEAPSAPSAPLAGGATLPLTQKGPREGEGIDIHPPSHPERAREGQGTDIIPPSSKKDQGEGSTDDRSTMFVHESKCTDVHVELVYQSFKYSPDAH